MGHNQDHTIAYLGKRIGKLRDRCEALARVCNEEASKKAKLQVENAELVTVHRRQADMLTNYADQIHRLTAERDTLGRSANDARAKVERLQGDLTEQIGRANDAERHLANRQEMAEAVARHAIDDDKILAGQTSGWLPLRRAHEEIVDELRAVNAEQAAGIANAEANAETAREKIAELKALVAELRIYCSPASGDDDKVLRAADITVGAEVVSRYLVGPWKVDRWAVDGMNVDLVRDPAVTNGILGAPVKITVRPATAKLETAPF